MAHKPNINSEKNFNLLEYKYITNEQFYKTNSHIYENKSDKIKIIKAYDSSESIAVRNNVVIESSGEFESDLNFEGERRFFVEHKNKDKQDKETGENSKNPDLNPKNRITMFQVTDQTEKIKNKIEKLNQQQFHEETNYLRNYDQQSKKPWKIKFNKRRSDGNFFYYGAIVFMVVTILLFIQAFRRSEVDIYKYLCLFGLFFHVLCLVWYYVLSLEVVTVGPMSGYFSVKKR